MTRGARVHSERGVRGLRVRRATADMDNKAGDVPHRTRAPRVSVVAFRSAVWRYWKKEGRHELPWRKTTDPYRILVSEVMLQQTQVPRVIEKYKEFLGAFPNVRALAKAPLANVLRVWSGMGYNRRAKYLRDAAIIIVRDYNGRIPRGIAKLRELPGIGLYTASAIRVFAFNKPDILIETNIRAAYIHHFHTGRSYVVDREIEPIARLAAKGEDPRLWHSALMDYGAHIKKLHKNPARKSAHYVRQSKFEGSLRQVRGAILKAFAHKTSLSVVRKRYSDRFDTALASLMRDGLVRGGRSI